MENIIQKVLEKIKNSKITPKPRWIFVARNIFYWFLAPVFLIFGGLSFSIIIYMFLNNDWDLRARVGGSLFGFLIATLPYLWIILFILFVIAGYFYFRRTKSGYKYEFLKTVSYGGFIIVVLGMFFYFSRFGVYIDRNLSKMEFYNRFSCPNAKMWNRPDKGIISGEVIDFDLNGNMKFIDINGKPWDVKFPKEMPLNFREMIEENNNRIKIIGNRFDDAHFDLESIRPFRCGCMMEDCNCGKNERNFPDMRNNSCTHD